MYEILFEMINKQLIREKDIVDLHALKRQIPVISRITINTDDV